MNTIPFTATVREVKNEQLLVELDSDSCCGGVCGRATCGRSIWVSHPADQSFVVDEKVILKLSSKTFWHGAIWLYVAPSLAVILGALLFDFSEGAAVAGAAAGFALWYVLTLFFRRWWRPSPLFIAQ